MELTLNTNRLGITESQVALITNTVATGISVCILLNAEIAVICMVANVAFSLLTENQDKVTSWFTWNNKAVKDLKDYWKGSLPYFKFKLGMVLVRKIFFAAEKGQQQTVVKIFITALQNPLVALWMAFRICILAPVIEEIIFRGFLQEKIRNFQVLVFGEKAVDKKVHKVFRIGLQAAIFGLAHVRPEQAGINGIIFLITGLGGAYNGYLKEKTSALWCSMAEHAHWNASSTLAVVADHFLPSLPVAAPSA